jgi:hypothetical protein
MAKEKKSANVITIAERALQLGMVNLKMEQPSKAQKERFPNTLANVSFELLINSQIEATDDAGNEQTDRIRISGIKLVKTDMGELRVYTPRINNFFPIGSLGPDRNKFLFEVYEKLSQQWAMLPELPDINEQEIEVAEVMA